MRFRGVLFALALSAPGAVPIASAQEPAPHVHQSPAPTEWHGMQDGVVYGLFNHQGGPRGGDEFVVPNWWMGMAMRDTGRHHSASTRC